MQSCPLCGRSVVDDGCTTCGWGLIDDAPVAYPGEHCSECECSKWENECDQECAIHLSPKYQNLNDLLLD